MRRIVALGGVIAGIGSLLFGLAETLFTASIGRLLVGLGVSFMFLSLLKINALWFRERHFGTITGFTMLLGNAGAVLAAAPLVWVLGFTSWRTVFVVLGIFSGVLALLTWFVVRDHPRDAGLPSMRELEGLAPHAARTGHWWRGLVEVAKNRDTWPGFFPAFGTAGTLLAFAGLWAVPFLRDVYAMPRDVAVLHTSWLLIGFALGSFFVGTLSGPLAAAQADNTWRRRYLSSMLATVVVPVAAAGGGRFAAVFPDGCWRCRVFARLGRGQGSEPPGALGHGHERGQHRRVLSVALLQPLVGWVMDLGWDGRMADGVRLYSAANHQLGIGILSAWRWRVFSVRSRYAKPAVAMLAITEQYSAKYRNRSRGGRTAMAMKLGFIGLGIMGRPMALNLRKAGHTAGSMAGARQP